MSCPESFHCIYIFFIIQDFWATCACPENRICPELTVLNIYFLSFRIFEQHALALKAEFALKFFKTGVAVAPPDPPTRSPMALRYSQAYVGFDRVNHSKSIFITTENHHAGETFMLAPLLFSFVPLWPPNFVILESPLVATRVVCLPQNAIINCMLCGTWQAMWKFPCSNNFQHTITRESVLWRL